ncbi:MAG TPA: cation transporter [Bacteroidales bacterium]|nr:cation transporter [Bacteroidales bacterium]
MTSSKLTAGLLLGLMLLITSCGGGKSKEAKTAPAATATIELSIGGMTCTGCENTIQTNLSKVPGIISVTASYQKGNAVIEYEPGKVDTVKIKEVVDGTGYTALKVSPAEPEVAD